MTHPPADFTGFGHLVSRQMATLFRRNWPHCDQAESGERRNTHEPGESMGRRGPSPDHAKREAFATLIAEGVPSARACRMVGIHPRTGKRWRNGRRLASKPPAYC